MRQRDSLPYEADGMVIKVSVFDLQKKLGVVGNAPRWAIAYKFPAREVTTYLHKIGVNVGRTGVLAPYATLESVSISGVMVSQASLHNFEDITRKDIREGDTVIVKRAGDVIPQVVRPVLEQRQPESAPYRSPDCCPSCGELVVKQGEEVDVYCINTSCPAQLVCRVKHFVSRGAMDIKGFGGKVAEQLVQAGLIHNMGDIYTLKREQLINLEGFGERKVDKLLSVIEQSRKQPLERLVIALGIKGVGKTVAKALMGHYPSLMVLAAATVEDMQSIEGVGLSVAESVVDWFGSPQGVNEMEAIENF